ncbi:MAG: D-aminoacylase [candidate division KSB1 bacterium]|nr:D-aminoacylase [candidate division KSB1 bacterium]
MAGITRRHFLQESVRALAGAPFVFGSRRPGFDLLILGALVYDGTGGDPFPADVGIRAGKVAAIGNLAASRAREVIEAKGLALAPGFVDVHAHTDIELLVDGRAQSKVQQGVTTEISGNCGESPFPLLGESGEEQKARWKNRYGIEAEWKTAGGFLNAVERAGISLNYATLVGHGTLRASAMGLENRPPSERELARMEVLLAEALNEGVLGLSTGLEYAPGAFADREELVRLVQKVSSAGAIYATHMRNEDVHLLEAVDEALDVARRTGCSLQISHFKASQPRNWPLQEAALEKIRKASAEGLKVHIDCYPYTAFGTTAQVLFPIWAREGGGAAFVQRLRDDGLWPQMAAFAEDKVGNLGGWQNLLLSRIGDSRRSHWQGRRLDELAREQGVEPLALLRDLLVASGGEVSIVAFAMSESNLEKALAFPLTMVGSDGNAVSPEGPLGQGHPHPRYYGTFPRVLGLYVRQRKVLTLQEAIHKMTGLPARKFGLRRRGLIREGYFADLVIFDPDTVADRATFEEPHRFPEGIALVVVNGIVVVREGEHTGAKPGRVLRRFS